MLVKADPNVAEYDLFTKDGTRYHFKLADSEVGQINYRAQGGSDSVFQLRYIQDANGNTTSLYYSKKDTNSNGNAAALPAALLNGFDDDDNTLDVVTDSSGRALVFNYQKIFDQQRIVKITGYDSAGHRSRRPQRILRL